MLLSIALTVIAAEVAIRFTGVAKPPTDHRSPYPRYYFAADDALGFDLSKNFPPSDFELTDYADAHQGYFKIWTNDLGCFDRLATTANDAILLVGDSFAWGYAPLEKTWGSIVERQTGSRVIKCGVGGFGPKQARLKSGRIIRQLGAPSIVVLSYFVGNDLMDDYLFPQNTVNDGYLATRVTLVDDSTGSRRILTDAEVEANKRAALDPPDGLSFVKRFVANHSIIYNLLRDNVVLRRLAATLSLADPPRASGIPLIYAPRDKHPWLEAAWREQFDSLRSFATEVKSEGSQLLVVIIPTREQVYPARRPRGEADWDSPTRRVRDFLQKQSIPVIDLSEQFRLVTGSPQVTGTSADLYWPNDIHLTPTGNKLAGLLVSQYLLTHHLVKSLDRQVRLAKVEAELALSFPAR